MKEKKAGQQFRADEKFYKSTEGGYFSRNPQYWNREAAYAFKGKAPDLRRHFQSWKFPAHRGWCPAETRKPARG